MPPDAPLDLAAAADPGRVHLEPGALGDTVVLDRPQRRNALTVELWQQLADHYAQSAH